MFLPSSPNIASSREIEEIIVSFWAYFVFYGTGLNETKNCYLGSEPIAASGIIALPIQDTVSQIG
jgi:hypothetical protein